MKRILLVSLLIAMISFSISSSDDSIMSSSDDVFDIRDYGATGDGKTDDALLMQAAIDAAEASGGVLYLATGRTFCLASDVRVDADLTVSGYGATIMMDGGDINIEGATLGGQWLVRKLTVATHQLRWRIRRGSIRVTI